MIDIDYIMTLLDWNESDENQCYGLELAKKVNCFNVFCNHAIKILIKMCGIIVPRYCQINPMKNYPLICRNYLDGLKI